MCLIQLDSERIFLGKRPLVFEIEGEENILEVKKTESTHVSQVNLLWPKSAGVFYFNTFSENISEECSLMILQTEDCFLYHEKFLGLKAQIFVSLERIKSLCKLGRPMLLACYYFL